MKEWEEEFDETFVFSDGFVDCHADDVKDFISETIEKEVEKERESLAAKVEDYFRGLILIPDPQATLKNLLNLLRKPSL